MACNKVITKDGRTLLDLTEDDVTQEDVLQGKKFHGRDGVGKTGTLTPQTDSLVRMWEEFKEANLTNWSYAFGQSKNVSGHIITPSIIVRITYEDLSKLDFSDDIVGSRNFSGMFMNCTKLKTVPQMNTHYVSNFSSMFYGCSSLETIPEFYTNQATNMAGMFYGCSSLKTVPLMNMQGVSNIEAMFAECTSLTIIPAFNLSNVTNMTMSFPHCTSLTEFHAYGMKASFDLSYSTLMSETALVEVLNNLATVTSTKTLTLGSTLLNKLTADEKAIATNKGWTLK